MIARLLPLKFSLRDACACVVVFAIVFAVACQAQRRAVASKFVDELIRREKACSETDNAQFREIICQYPDFSKKEGVVVWAVRFGERQTVSCLLRKGANANDEDDYWKAPALFWAVAAGRVHVAAELIEKGATPSPQLSVSGYPTLPINIACRDGEVAIVDLLVRNGVSANQFSGNGNLPIHFAIRSGNAQVVELLMKHGADLSQSDSHGHTCLQIAQTCVRFAALKGDVSLERNYRDILQKICEATDANNEPENKKPDALLRGESCAE